MNLIKSFLEYREHNRLSYQIVLAVVICSLFFTLLAASVQLYFDYRKDVESIHQNMRFIEESYLQAIASSFYNFDKKLLKIQLEGVLQLQDVIYLEVTEMTEQEHVFMAVGKPDRVNTVATTFPLNHTDFLGQTFPIGSLTVIASLDGVYHRLWRNAVLILISTTIQTFLVAFVILVIIQFIVTRPLIDMARYTEQLDIEHLDTTLKIRRRRIFSTKPDELDQVINAMNDLRVRLQQDITERKQAEEALRENEERLRVLFNSAQDNILVHPIGEDGLPGKYIDVNRSTCETLGYTREELLQMGPQDTTIVEDPSMIAEITKRIIQDGHALFEASGMTKDGKKIPFEINAHLIKIGDEQIVMAVSRNISERKEAEEQLQILSSVVKQSAHAIAIIDREGIVEYANPTFLERNNYSADQVIGKNWRSFVSQYSTLREKYQEIYDTVINKGMIWKGEVSDRAKDSKVIWRESTLFPIKNEKGSLIHSVYMSEDITERKRAEEALRESEEKFRTLAETAPVGILITLGGKFLYVNAVVEQIFGYSKEELSSLNPFDFVHPDFRDIVINRNRERMAGKKVSSRLEIKIITKTGEERWIDGLAGLINVGEQSVTLTVFLDITERKRTEEALKASELRFRSLIEQTTDAVFCYEYDPPIPTDLPLEEQVKLMYQCTLVECNDVCARSYGARRADEVIGKKLTELFGTTPGSLDQLFTALIQGRYHIVDELGVEKLEDGTERYFLNNGHGIIEDGKLLRVWGTFRDVTEHKRAEEVLQESEEKFRTLAEQSPNMIFINKGGRVVYVNKHAEELMGYTKEEYYAMDFDFITLIAPEYKDLIISNFRKHIQGEELNPYEYALIKKAGKRVEVLVTTKLINYEGESAILGIVTDITERKRAEEEIRTLNAELEERVKNRTAELEAVNKELKSFAYVVSHDLKTPLRGISHLAHWLVDDYAEAFDEKGKEMTNLLISRVRRMDNLIDGILEYSRVGRIVAEEEQIDLNTLVRNVIDSLSLPEHIQVIIEQDLPRIVGDKIRFIQVFQNLIGNALEFIDKPEGKITISCADEGSHWRFRVADNGPGIDEQYHEKIFQIFQTLKSRDEHESTGIGLALVKKIVELYGGKIWVESTPGQGSVFSFTLPKKR